MLDKEKLIKLNKNQEYDEIYDIFLNEYKELIYGFLEKNDIDYIKGAPISYYVEVLESNFAGKYEDIQRILISSFVTEPDIRMLPLKTSISSYNYVKDRFK